MAFRRKRFKKSRYGRRSRRSSSRRRRSSSGRLRIGFRM